MSWPRNIIFNPEHIVKYQNADSDSITAFRWQILFFEMLDLYLDVGF
jgi:hypothetical protein